MGNSQGKKKSVQSHKGSATAKRARMSDSVPQKNARVSEDANDAPQDRQDRPRKKIVLLGSGDSGKSTIAKQIKMLQLGGYSAKEVQSFAPVIRQNALTAMKGFIERAESPLVSESSSRLRSTTNPF